MPELPSGTVTFLFTDIEGSTTRWEHHRAQMQAALARHDELLREAIAAHGGHVFKTVGDAFYSSFAMAPAALEAALAAQRALAAEPWPPQCALRVRLALHTGAAQERDGDYFGTALNRVARLLSAGHGGQVLLSEVTHGLVRDEVPEGVQLRDMGEHRLKDLIRPEHVYQLVAPDLPSEFPPLKSLDIHAHNLPVQPTALIGREREIAAVRARLLEPQTRLLTLTGAGGVGKTRLALQVAAEVLDAFRDGVYFVNLAPLSDPDLVLPAIAQKLGVVEQAGEPLLATLRGRLRGTWTLLVMDNFEQVVEAAAQVPALLEVSAGVKVLATSRMVLHVRGEREYPVPPLALPDPQHLPAREALSQYEAVRLFIARAQDVKPDFAMTNESAPVVAEICVRLDGLPLAIELAAARIRLLPPQALLSRLSNRLKLVTGGARDLPARQQTLRATIDWSYNLLTPVEQTLFVRLAVFVGGCTLEAVGVACNPEGDLDVLDGVESLLEKHLLQQKESVGGEPRFVMLETIHEYTRERLEASGESEELRRRHAAYYLDLAQQAAPAHGGTLEAAWLERLEREHDNLRAALGWAHDRGEGELEVRLAVALGEFWNTRGYTREARERLEGLLALQGGHEQALPPDLRAWVLHWQGHMIWLQGDYERAAPLLEECLALCRALRWTWLMALCLHRLGCIAREHGDYERATALYRELLALAQDMGDTGQTAWALLGLGDVAREQGDAAQVEIFGAESLTLCRGVGDKLGEGFALNNLGLAAWLQQDVPRATALFTDSLALFRELGPMGGVAEVLSNVGRLARAQGHLEQARTAFVESLALARTTGPMPVVAEDLEGLAGVAGAQQQAERAARLFGAAQALREAKRLPRWPIHQAYHERDVAATRVALGENAFAAAWAAGRALSVEQAIAQALEEAQA